MGLEARHHSATATLGRAWVAMQPMLVGMKGVIYMTMGLQYLDDSIHVARGGSAPIW